MNTDIQIQMMIVIINCYVLLVSFSFPSSSSSSLIFSVLLSINIYILLMRQIQCHASILIRYDNPPLILMHRFQIFSILHQQCMGSRISGALALGAQMNREEICERPSEDSSMLWRSPPIQATPEPNDTLIRRCCNTKTYIHVTICNCTIAEPLSSAMCRRQYHAICYIYTRISPCVH